jgi:hypothetical protein
MISHSRGRNDSLQSLEVFRWLRFLKFSYLYNLKDPADRIGARFGPSTGCVNQIKGIIDGFDKTFCSCGCPIAYGYLQVFTNELVEIFGCQSETGADPPDIARL